jgi:signal transduction histidine kinase
MVDGTANKITAETGAEIRRLAHDLSNALEIILQASYLLQLSTLDDNAKKWATMVDQGAQQAAEINRQLREFVRANTSA